MTREDETGLERIYGLLGHGTQLMLALGFFGTVLGISQSMFGSFGKLVGADSNQLKEGLQSFTGALGTALDTTLLAIICSLVASVVTAAMHWLETNGLESLEKSLCQRLSLEVVPIMPAAEVIQVMKAEMSILAQSLLNQMQSSMQELVVESGRIFETKLTEIVQDELSELRKHEGALASQFTESLQKQTAMAIHAMEEQNGLLRSEITGAIQGITTQFSRPPEISIRYPGPQWIRTHSTYNP